MIILEFLVSVLYILLVVVSTMVPTIYLGAQISPEFYKKRYWILVFLISLSARQTFGELFHIGIILFFQSIRYLFLTIWIRVLSGEPCCFVDSFSTLYRSVFDLLSIFLCCKIMKRWSLDLDLFFSDAFKTHYRKSFFIILPLTVFRIFSSFMTNINSSFYVRFDTTISLLIFILFFSWLFYIKHLEQVYRDEQTIQRQEDENRSLQGMVDKLGHLYDEVRGFRHDFAGIVASMEPAIANQDMAEVSTIYQDVFLKTNEKLRKADYTAFNLHNIHDIAIRNTLAKAMIVADNQGIHFSLETVGVVEELALPMLEAIRILSILTTNALEAASEAENPQIRVALLAGDRSVRFIIENTRKKEELNPSILSQKGYSTKGNHSGLGLATLEDMVFHYDLNLDTQLGETTFRQDLELPFKDEKRGGEE